MNATMAIRAIRISVVMLAVLAVGALSAHEAGATKNNGTNMPTIRERLKSFVEDCAEHGGESEVSYSYEGEDLVSANASCSGGGMNRSNCTFTADKTSCYNEPRHITAETTAVQSDGIPAGVATDPEPTGPTVGTRTNVDGSGDGNVAGLSTEPISAATGPTNVLVIEDEREP